MTAYFHHLAGYKNIPGTEIIRIEFLVIPARITVRRMLVYCTSNRCCCRQTISLINGLFPMEILCKGLKLLPWAD